MGPGILEGLLLHDVQGRRKVCTQPERRELHIHKMTGWVSKRWGHTWWLECLGLITSGLCNPAEGTLFCGCHFGTWNYSPVAWNTCVRARNCIKPHQDGWTPKHLRPHSQLPVSALRCQSFSDSKNLSQTRRLLLPSLRLAPTLCTSLYLAQAWGQIPCPQHAKTPSFVFCPHRRVVTTADLCPKKKRFYQKRQAGHIAQGNTSATFFPFFHQASRR